MKYTDGIVPDETTPRANQAQKKEEVKTGSKVCKVQWFATQQEHDAWWKTFDEIILKIR